MVNVSAFRTAKPFSVTRIGIDLPTRKTGLRTVHSGNFNQRPARPCQLVSEHLAKYRPSCTCNVSGQMVISNHPLHVELFEDDRSVAFGVGSRQLVQDVISLSFHLAVNTIDSIDSFRSVFGSSLSPRNDTLSTRKSSQRLFQVFGIRNNLTIRISKKIGDASVYCDNGFGSRGWGRCFDFAQQACKPLISVFANQTGFRLAFDGTVQDQRNIPKLRETEFVTIQSPRFRVRLTESKGVLAHALEFRGSTKFFETPLPSFVEFDEQLSANIPGDISKPWPFRSPPSQVVDLVESRKVSFWFFFEGSETLSKCVIPKPSQGMFPSIQPSNLLPSWIDAILKRLARKHNKQRILACAKVKRLLTWAPWRTRLLPALNGGVPASEK